MVPLAYLSLQGKYCIPLSRAREVVERIASQVAKTQIGRLAKTRRMNRRSEGERSGGGDLTTLK